MATMISQAVNQSLEKFDDYGYVVVPDLLSSDEVAYFNESLDSMPQRTSEENDHIIAGERQLLQDPRYLELLLKPRYQEAVEYVLRGDVQLTDIIGVDRPAQPDGFDESGSERGWHLDNWVHPPSPVLLKCTSLVYLQDMTEEIGPTYVIPMSHKWGRYPEAAERDVHHTHEMPVHAPAGACLIFHSNLWHSATPNRTSGSRRTFNINWGHHFLRRLDRFYSTPLPDYIVHHEDARVRVMFGLELPAGRHMGGHLYNERVYGG